MTRFADFAELGIFTVGRLTLLVFIPLSFFLKGLELQVIDLTSCMVICRKSFLFYIVTGIPPFMRRCLE